MRTDLYEHVSRLLQQLPRAPEQPPTRGASQAELTDLADRLKWRHKDIELAAHDLLQLLDAATGVTSGR